MATDQSDKPLREVKSCGFFVMKPDRSFLLMKHHDRYDLPKGHMESGENEHQTALRELMEETGIISTDIDIDPTFRFEEVYYPVYARFGDETVKKTLVIFLARLKSDAAKIDVTEHVGSEWMEWSSPPVPIQQKCIDPVANQVYQHLVQE